MTTRAEVKAAIQMDRLFGHDVKSLTVEGNKFYLVHTVFQHLGGITSSQTVKDKYCKRFPGMHQFAISWNQLRALCIETRSRKPSKLRTMIEKYEEAEQEIPVTPRPAGVNEGAIAIPDTVTVEANQLVDVVKKLGIGRVHTILQNLGFLDGLCDKPDAEKKPRVMKITIEY